MTYTIHFIGYPRGTATNCPSAVDVELEAGTEQQALLRLYDTYEHVYWPVIVAEGGRAVWPPRLPVLSSVPEPSIP